MQQSFDIASLNIQDVRVVVIFPGPARRIASVYAAFSECGRAGRSDGQRGGGVAG